MDGGQNQNSELKTDGWASESRPHLSTLTLPASSAKGVRRTVLAAAQTGAQAPGHRVNYQQHNSRCVWNKVV